VHLPCELLISMGKPVLILLQISTCLGFAPDQHLLILLQISTCFGFAPDQHLLSPHSPASIC